MQIRRKKHRTHNILCVLFTVSFFLLMQTQVVADLSGSWLSTAGLYRVSYASSLEPIEINQMHKWVLHVETPEGDPVIGADITVDGGMPMHNHGLPTSPQMTQSLSNGDYIIEGMRFHMMGHWELVISIKSKGESDTVVIPLKL